MICQGGWTAWLGGGSTQFMGAQNTWHYPVYMNVITGGPGYGGRRNVCVGPGKTLWEDSSAIAAGVVVMTANYRVVIATAVPCTHPEF